MGDFRTLGTRLAMIAAAVVIAGSLGRAQTGTAEGVQAFTRGDYQRAAAIFDVLAMKSPRLEPAAAFFLAAMYENGLGVPQDSMRACALYVRASVDSTTPFGRQAGALLDALRRRSLTDEAFEDCLLYASIGFDHRFRPETFVLEPGYSISWDLRGATINYQGTETWVEAPLVQSGSIFVQMQHTELSGGSLRAERRHFIEAWTWQPGEGRQTWKLIWRLFEVAGNKLESVAAEDVTTTSAPEPPTDPSFDVRKFVRLGVNDHGGVEWTVLEGPRAQTQIVEPQAERDAAREKARARKDAEARVDWTRVVDVHRTPSLTYTDADGCGHVFVYGWSADRTEVIGVRADKDLLQLTTTTKMIDAAAQRNGLEVTLHMYEQPVRSWPFCTDIGFPAAVEETWRMTRGTVAIVLSEPGVVPQAPFMYRATITIVGAEFVNSSGVRMTQAHPITLIAIVGWMAG